MGKTVPIALTAYRWDDRSLYFVVVRYWPGSGI
jgi:hypothetical protein